MKRPLIVRACTAAWYNYRTSFSISIGLAIILAVAALDVHFHEFINSDNGWLLYATKRYLSGERPYVDFLETNPPLIMWLLALPVWIAKLLNWNVIPVFYCYVMLLLAVSITLVCHELRNHKILGDPRYGNVVLAALALSLLTVSCQIYGQREHLFIVLALPYLIQSLVLEREPQWGMRQGIIAAAAGIGFMLKPFFLLIWVAGELYNAVISRHPALLLRRSNWVIALISICYPASILYFTPEYISRIMPYLMLTYGAYNHETKEIIVELFLLLPFYLLPLLFALPLPRSMVRMIGQLFFWLAASLVFAFMQGKGWLYHWYPFMVFGGLLMSIAMVAMLQRQFNSGKDMPPLRFALLCLTGMFLFAMPAYMPAYDLLAIRNGENVTAENFTKNLEKFVTSYPVTGKNIYIFSFNLVGIFPAVNYLPVQFPFHFHHLWTMPAFLKEERAHAVLSPSMAEIKAFTVNTVTADMKKYLPELVLVDSNSRSLEIWKDFDFIGYFSRNPEFSALWQHYVKVGNIVIMDSPFNASVNDAPVKTYFVYVLRP